jgi:hypothetical protein
MDTTNIVTVAEGILSQQFGTQVRLRQGDVYTTYGSLAIRCHLLTASSDAPATVMVKHALPRPEYPMYDTYALLNDWAACQFLSNVASDLPLAPRFCGGDSKRNILILEDLGRGTGPNTADLLNGTDPDLAQQGLIEHTALLGRFHGATIGKADEYCRLRDTLGPQAPPRELYTDPWSNARRQPFELQEIERAIQHYHAVFDTISVQPQAGVDEDIMEVTTQVEHDPGPYLAFCKGDQHLGGDYIRCGDKLRLYDFGAGGFRHALIEGMPGRMTWGCYGHIPRDIVPNMEAAYQAEFSPGCPEAADEARFHRAMVEAGARWNILHVIHRVPDALERDGLRGPTTMRRLCLAWIEAFADLSEQLSHRQALGRSARDMALRLRALLSVEGRPQPDYPAFARR